MTGTKYVLTACVLTGCLLCGCIYKTGTWVPDPPSFIFGVGSQSPKSPNTVPPAEAVIL